jgi:hypothetical protein
MTTSRTTASFVACCRKTLTSSKSSAVGIPTGRDFRRISRDVIIVKALLFSRRSVHKCCFSVATRMENPGVVSISKETGESRAAGEDESKAEVARIQVQGFTRRKATRRNFSFRRGAGAVHCSEISQLMSVQGHYPNRTSGFPRPLPPGADMIGEGSPLIKLAHVARRCC